MVLGIFCSQASRKTKREIIQSWIYRILPKANQVIYTLDIICDANIMTLTQAVLEIFCSQASFGYNEKIEKGDNSVMDLQNFTKSKSDHLGHNL